MTTREFVESTEAQLLPQLVRLSDNLCAAVFSLMKLVPARHILRKAAEHGELGPDTLIAETTSGTFGLALAMQSALMRRRLVLVSDPVIDANLHRRLTDLGAEVVICEQPAAVGGFQEARLRRLEEILAEHPDGFCPRQYSNPDNPAAYAIVADHMLRTLGAVDCVIGPVGSGGSMCGTVTMLRSAGSDVHAVAVDTPGSVLFGQPDGNRALRGLGMSVLPSNLDHQVFDEVHWCTAGEAYAATRQLHRRHAVFQGPTSGAAYQVARWWADAHPDMRCVVMLPDGGHRYQETVYNDQWLAAQGFDPPRATAGRDADDRYGDGPMEPPHLIPSHPIEVSQPNELINRWSRFAWRRRRYSDVTGPRPAPV